MAERLQPSPRRPALSFGTVSAESLFAKYSLPAGTNSDAIARVLARLGDLPFPQSSGASGVSGERDRGGGNVGGHGRECEGSSPAGAAFRDAADVDGGGSPRCSLSARRSLASSSPTGARVVWISAAADGAGDDALSRLRDNYGGGDRGVPGDTSGGSGDLSDEERAVRCLASARASRLSADERLAKRKQELERANHLQRSGGGGGGDDDDDGNHGDDTTGGGAVSLTPKQRAGVLGKLKDETAAANGRSRRLETALQRRDQEVQTLNPKP